MADSGWSEEKFRALTMYSGDIISLLDAQGRLLFNSPATARISGFSPEELQNQDTFELIHPDDRAEVSRIFGEVLATPGAQRTVEYRYRTKSGGWLWMEAVACNQLENPAVQGVVASSRDISERKRAEAERQRLEQHMLHVQKLESLGVMAGGVAHDFNNLLAMILGETSVLQRSLPPGFSESLATIENAAHRAADLTQQLLAYAGRRVAPHEPTNLRVLISDLAPLLRLSARGEAHLTLELADGVPPVVCDRGQVRQVLLNLVLNAAESLSHEGSVTVRLALRDVEAAELAGGPFTAGFAPGPAVVLEVADSGAGMTAETQQRIFDPFFSTKQTGRGLGLAAVLGIVRSHGAGLRLESAAGAGTSFRIYFRPSLERETPPPGRAPAKFEGAALVIDDDPLVAKTTARVLRLLGFECTVAVGGEEALARFGPQHVVVVCDVLMPGLDGPSTVAKLRAVRPVPVLFVSGYSPDPGLLPEDGETAFLGKPFDATTVARSLLSLRRLQPAAGGPAIR